MFWVWARLSWSGPGSGAVDWGWIGVGGLTWPRRYWLCALWPSCVARLCWRTAAQTRAWSRRRRRRRRGRWAGGPEASRRRSCWWRRGWRQTGSAGGWGSPRSQCGRRCGESGGTGKGRTEVNPSGACRRTPRGLQGKEPSKGCWGSEWDKAAPGHC